MPQRSYMVSYRHKTGAVERTKAFGSWRERARFIASKGVRVVRYWEA